MCRRMIYLCHIGCAGQIDTFGRQSSDGSHLSSLRIPHLSSLPPKGDMCPNSGTRKINATPYDIYAISYGRVKSALSDITHLDILLVPHLSDVLSNQDKNPLAATRRINATPYDIFTPYFTGAPNRRFQAVCQRFGFITGGAHYLWGFLNMLGGRSSQFTFRLVIWVSILVSIYPADSNSPHY